MIAATCLVLHGVDTTARDHDIMVIVWAKMVIELGHKK